MPPWELYVALPLCFGEISDANTMKSINHNILIHFPRSRPYWRTGSLLVWLKLLCFAKECAPETLKRCSAQTVETQTCCLNLNVVRSVELRFYVPQTKRRRRWKQYDKHLNSWALREIRNTQKITTDKRKVILFYCLLNCRPKQSKGLKGSPSETTYPLALLIIYDGLQFFSSANVKPTGCHEIFQ